MVIQVLGPTNPACGARFKGGPAACRGTCSFAFLGPSREFAEVDLAQAPMYRNTDTLSEMGRASFIGRQVCLTLAGTTCVCNCAVFGERSDIGARARDHHLMTVRVDTGPCRTRLSGGRALLLKLPEHVLDSAADDLGSRSSDPMERLLPSSVR